MAKKNSIPTNYWQASTLLGARSVRMIAGKRATKLIRMANTEIDLYYHDTPVVTFRIDGTKVLRANGHQSVTTKRRMNEAGARVFQKDFAWFVQTESGVEPFFDGIKIPA